jgi:hypothetical protein
VAAAGKASSRKACFFEKKQQKTLAQLASAFPRRLSLNLSKFFGSFFQKEPLSFRLACRGGDLHTWAVTFFQKRSLFLAPQLLAAAAVSGEATGLGSLPRVTRRSARRRMRRPGFSTKR